MKTIENLYCIDSIKEFERKVKLAFGDALGGVTLARNLTHVDPTILTRKVAGLELFNTNITIDNSGGFANVIKSLRIADLGGFELSSNKGANKGQISITSEDSDIFIKQLEASSSYDVTELKQAALSNVNLSSKLLQAHNTLYQRKLDRIGMMGIDGNLGLLNNTSFTASAAGGAISTLTAQQKYDAFASLIADQASAVANVPEYTADTVMMPIDVMNDISSSIMNTAAGDKSILQALQSNHPGVKFMTSFLADSADLAATVTVAFCSKRDSIVFRLPTQLNMSSVYQQGHKFFVDSFFRVGGIDILESDSGRILTGL